MSLKETISEPYLCVGAMDWNFAVKLQELLYNTLATPTNIKFNKFNHPH